MKNDYLVIPGEERSTENVQEVETIWMINPSLHDLFSSPWHRDCHHCYQTVSMMKRRTESNAAER